MVPVEADLRLTARWYRRPESAEAIAARLLQFLRLLDIVMPDSLSWLEDSPGAPKPVAPDPRSLGARIVQLAARSAEGKQRANASVQGQVGDIWTFGLISASVNPPLRISIVVEGAIPFPPTLPLPSNVFFDFPGQRSGDPNHHSIIAAMVDAWEPAAVIRRGASGTPEVVYGTDET